MRSNRSRWRLCLCGAGLVILILDTKTALVGMEQALDLCLHTVIPSLFPFLFLSNILSSQLIDQPIRLLKPINGICGIPTGAESIWILGILGGYPVGAQLVYRAWHEGRICATDARRMLGFCSNAGPAFIFGIGSTLLPQNAIGLVWAIHIISSLIVGTILPRHKPGKFQNAYREKTALTKSLEESIRIQCMICGWVIIFRVIITFLKRWVLWLIPTQEATMIIGILELTNGCVDLLNISQCAFRFLFMATFMGFGGICVGMQTASIAKNLGTGWYFPGKLLQGGISLLLANGLQSFVFSENETYYLPYAILLPLFCFIVLYTICLHYKKTVAFHRIIMYNKKEVRM